jgi:hypothetical protein
MVWRECANGLERGQAAVCRLLLLSVVWSVVDGLWSVARGLWSVVLSYSLDEVQHAVVKRDRGRWQVGSLSRMVCCCPVLYEHGNWHPFGPRERPLGHGMRTKEPPGNRYHTKSTPRCTAA